MERKQRAESHWQLPWAGLAGLLVAIAAVAGLALLSRAAAQETPAATELASPSPLVSPGAETPAATPGVEPTPTVVTETVMRLEVDQAIQPVHSGDEFEVRVVVDRVEHLGAFDAVLEYDPDRLEPVGAGEGTPGAPETSVTQGDTLIRGDLGEFIKASPRGEATACQGPYTTSARPASVLALCVSTAPPLCLAGPEGASGSGVLARAVFKSKGGDMTALRLTSSNLVSDDVEPPCDPEDFRLQRIPHRVEDTTVLLAGGGGGAGLLIGIIVGVVVVALLAAGGGAYVWYRRRAATGI